MKVRTCFVIPRDVVGMRVFVKAMECRYKKVLPQSLDVSGSVPPLAFGRGV